MTNDERQSIIVWLGGSRNMREGAALYRRLGFNRMLMRRFETDDSPLLARMLAEELRKLAGLSQAQMRLLPKQTKPVDEATESAHHPLLPCGLSPEDSFRKRYPFLSEPGCPDSLKILVSDMFAAHDRFVAAHARLRALGPDQDGNADCRECVGQYLANKEAWRELEYYRDHGTLLCQAAKLRSLQQAESLGALSDVELVKKLQSARAQKSKADRAFAAAEDGSDAQAKASEVRGSWLMRKSLLEAEIERRKKK